MMEEKPEMRLVLTPGGAPITITADQPKQQPDPLQSLQGVQINAQQAASFKANVERAKREREFKPTLGVLFPSLGSKVKK